MGHSAKSVLALCRSGSSTWNNVQVVENRNDFSVLDPLAHDFFPRENCSMSLTTNACVYTVNSTSDANSAPFVSNLKSGTNAIKCGNKYFLSSSVISAETNGDSHPLVTNGPLPLNPLAACFIPQIIRPLGANVYESDDPLDEAPPICNVETPDVTPDASFVQSLEINDGAELQSCQHDILFPPMHSTNVDLNPCATSFVPNLADIDFIDSSTGPCSLLYPSDFNDISAVNLVNSALFVSNSAIDENDDDMTKFCNSSMKLWTKQRVDSHPPDTSMTALNPLALDFTPEATRLLTEQNCESDNPLDRTPPICDTKTPDLSFEECPAGSSDRAELNISSDQNDDSCQTQDSNCDETNSNVNPFVDFPLVTESDIGNVSVSEDIDDPQSNLDGLKEKNMERPVIPHLNINSISSKFEPLIRY